MIPLAKAMAMRLKQSYLLLVLCITAGAAMANSLVPPTPGPLFLIAEMDIPIGMMMVGGFLVGSVTIIVGYFFAVWVNKRNPIPLRESLDAPLSEIEALANKDAAQLPSLGISLSPILVPLVLITGSATVHTFMDIDSTMNSNKLLLLLQFFGEKIWP